MTRKATIQLGKVLRSADIDEAFTVTLKSLLGCRHHAGTYPNGQPDKAHGSKEILNFQVTPDCPEDSILTNPARHFQKKDTRARTVWIFELNSHFEDMTFYQPMIGFYSDNQISMSGSNYRQCIFKPRQGLNQAGRVITALHREIDSGYGTLVWRSEDVMRDVMRNFQVIPCNGPSRWEEIENCSDYILRKIIQPGLVAKLGRYGRGCFRLWVGLKPLSWVSDLSADALISAALFFIVHPSCMLANQTLNRLHASINQLKPFLEVCILV